MKKTTEKFIILFLIAIICSFHYQSFAVNTWNQDTKDIIIDDLQIKAEAAILIEPESGKIIYSKNANQKMYPASTTKIMTAILSIENCNLDELATVSKNAINLVPSGYSNAKLVAGEKLTIKDLLYALMLNSANEAANVLAEHVSGSVDNFAILMTEKAKEIGCKNTNFINANGMHNENHYTTAEDLAIIANYCMKNETFRQIVSTVEYELPATDLYRKNDRIMKNTNYLINPNSKYYLENAIGIKTGFTSQAGNCLISCAKTDDVELICVVLKTDTTSGSGNRFSESKALLEYGINNFSNRNIIEKNKIVDSIQIKNATKETQNVKIITKETISDYISNDINIEELEANININKNLIAPISAGYKVGTISYSINGKTYSTDLITKTEVLKSYTYVYYSIAIGLLLLIVSIILIINKNKKKK